MQVLEWILHFFDKVGLRSTRRTFLEMSGEASIPTTQNQTRRRYYRKSR